MIGGVSILEWLESWYREQCDGHWEDAFGVNISTLDNPGWWVKIDTKRPPVPERLTLEHRDEADDDWFRCWVEGNVFQGVGDPTKLRSILEAFRRWVEPGTGT